MKQKIAFCVVLVTFIFLLSPGSLIQPRQTDAYVPQYVQKLIWCLEGFNGYERICKQYCYEQYARGTNPDNYDRMAYEGCYMGCIEDLARMCRNF